jgi:stage V sporulation protein R
MTDNSDTVEKQRIATDLTPVVEAAHELARSLGLDPYPVDYWIVDNDEMNELIAYDGFQTRYPHWRWGMKYTQQAVQNQYAGGKAFEIVNNDNPSAAFLQQSNSIADQKAVITHVEAHADFFKHNQWFSDDPSAADLLAQHAQRIQSYMDDPEIGREAVESFIDDVTTIADHIDHTTTATRQVPVDDSTTPTDDTSLDGWISDMRIRGEVKDQVFDSDWLDDNESTDDTPDPETDVLAFLHRFGQQYDADREQAVTFDAWQRDVLSMLRTESYYFAPQRLTKTMNEGWASYWESIMMTDETLAGSDEIITYADHMAQVLNSPGYNPYKLGKAMWEYIENDANRTEVVDKLLRVRGVTPRSFHDTVDFEAVHDHFTFDSTYDPAKRHYSLARPENRAFLENTSRKELEEHNRYIMDTDRYDTVAEALADVDPRAGWDRLFEVRETHNDITFIEQFFTQEFVVSEQYFSYEYNHNTDQMEVSSTDVEDVKKKLLLNMTNFGKPAIHVAEKNYQNQRELLLEHDYNGVMLDLQQAEKTLERVFNLWGRPVNLKTIIKTSDDGQSEEGRLFRYNGETHHEKSLRWNKVEHLSAASVDYDTKPDEWV